MSDEVVGKRKRLFKLTGRIELGERAWIDGEYPEGADNSMNARPVALDNEILFTWQAIRWGEYLGVSLGNELLNARSGLAP